MATATSLSLPSPRPRLLSTSPPGSRAICAGNLALLPTLSSSCCSFPPCRYSGQSPAHPSDRQSFVGNVLQQLNFLNRRFTLIQSRTGKEDALRAVEGTEAPVAVDPSPSDIASEKLRNIWMSDVVVQGKKPYFLHRQWTDKDIVYAGFMVLVHGLCVLAPFTFTWKAFGAFVLLYFVTGMLGITLSYHRNLSHRSFKLPKWLEYTFAYCGVLAMQGDPLEWVSSHRYHHQHCDTDQDPHSPCEGFWYSHMGWLFDYTSTIKRVGARANIGDMAKDPFYQFIQKTYIIHPVALGAGLYALGGLPFFVWGMAIRTAWVYHITWAVNSAAHVWGSQAWNTGDLSRNNWWVALLAFGEGWHNNHHAFEYSARHGLEWWQLDLTWYCVLALEKMGLATKVRLPTKEHMSRLAFKSP